MSDGRTAASRRWRGGARLNKLEAGPLHRPRVTHAWPCCKENRRGLESWERVARRTQQVPQDKEFTSMPTHCKRLTQAMRMAVSKPHNDRHVLPLGTPHLDGGQQRGYLSRMLAAHELV